MTGYLPSPSRRTSHSDSSRLPLRSRPLGADSGSMALRRAKHAVALAAVPPPAPAPTRPAAGYDARTVAEAAEILRHQALVLGVRSRVAAAAGGLAPIAEPAQAALPEPDDDAARSVDQELRAVREALENLQAPVAVDFAPVLAELRELAGRLDDQARPVAQELRKLGDGLDQLQARQALPVAVDFAPVLAELHELAGRLDERAALDREQAALDKQASQLAKSEESTARLQSRLDEREQALRRAEKELAAREAALESESRRLAKTDESTARLQRELAEREQALEQRRDDLRRAEKELRNRDQLDERNAKARERELAARESALDKRASRLAKDEESTAQLQRQVDEAERALRQRTAELEQRSEDLRRAEQALLKARDQIDAVKPSAAPVAPVEAAPEPPAPAHDDASRNVESLAALVSRHAAEFPEQAEEWRWYVQSLRDVAEIDGRLPASVEGLVLDVFGPLLERD